MASDAAPALIVELAAGPPMSCHRGDHSCHLRGPGAAEGVLLLGGRAARGKSDLALRPIHEGGAEPGGG